MKATTASYEVGQKVEVNPEVAKPEFNGTYTEILRTYQNGKVVVMGLGHGQTQKIESSQIRPYKSQEMRQEEAAAELAQMIKRIRSRIEKPHDKLHGLQSEFAKTNDLSYELRWHAENVFDAVAEIRLYAEWDVAETINKIESGGWTLAEAIEHQKGCEEYTRRSLIDSPYRHSSTSAMSNLEEERTYVTRCGCVSRQYGGSIACEMKMYHKQIERTLSGSWK